MTTRTKELLSVDLSKVISFFFLKKNEIHHDSNWVTYREQQSYLSSLQKLCIPAENRY